MSYEPSHRKPPRQERWPNATPGEGWPAYQEGDGSRALESAAAFPGSRNGYGAAGNGHGAAGNGHGAAGNGHAGAWGGRTTTSDGNADARGGHTTTSDGYGDARGGARYTDPGPGYWAGGNGYGGTAAAYPAAGDGYAGGGYTDGFDAAADGYAGTAGGYGAARDYQQDHQQDYQATANGYDGWDGYTQPGHEFGGPAGYLAQDEYPALDPAASSVLVATDTMGEWWRRADRSPDGDRGPGERGPIVGAVMGLLAIAVAVGVATFAAAFVRPQASPVSAVTGVFIDHLPASLKSPMAAHFGGHGQSVLLLGAIALAAMALGGMARRKLSIAVAGVAAFGLLGAFVAITRPESRASDVIPWAIGGTAGILALVWLARASAPVTTLRPDYGGGRRRAR